MENLAVQIKKMWEDNEDEFEKKLNDWLRVLEKGEKLISRARKQFHQWEPLRVYVSVTKAKSNSRVLFSLRFFGQEVAELFVEDGKVTLRLEKRHSEKNRKYFGCTLKEGDYNWNDKEAKDFRSYFKKLASHEKGIPEVKMCEHRIESKFIQEMLKPSGKFGLSDLKIRPVTIGGCPLQFPVPISASTGRPEKSKGNIDILARHQDKDNKTRLSVWELKKPNTYNHAASQAYIYALTLLQVLRHTKNASKWYKIFGYKSLIPKKLEIEAVVAITSNQKEKFNKEKTELKKNTSFEIDGDKIELYAAYYTEEAQSIKLERNPFRENQ
jgi:hypothetical protein